MKKLLIIATLFISTQIFAQYGETIRTGRPGQAIGGFTTGANVFQFQTGITLDKTNFDAPINGSQSSFQSSSVFRYGITETFEVSGVLGYKSLKDKFDDQSILDAKFTGIDNTQLGVRFNVLSGKTPLCVQYRVKLNALSDDYKNKSLGGRLLIAGATKLGNPLKLTVNLGMDWSGNVVQPSGLYVFNFSFDITPKIGGFVEYYGNVPFIEDGLRSWSNNIDAGIGYLVNKDLQLDISAGTNLDSYDVGSNIFIDFGLSWRTKL